MKRRFCAVGLLLALVFALPSCGTAAPGAAQDSGTAASGVSQDDRSYSFDSGEMVSPDKISCELDDTMQEWVSSMPDVSNADLPAWKGYTIVWWLRENLDVGIQFSEDELQIIADSGFNFIRVPLYFNMFFDGEDTGKVRKDAFDAVDALLRLCAEKQIHVCLDLHDMPGFFTGNDEDKTDLFTNESHQVLFTQFWSVLARYYRNVPVKLLSFNLLNEPHLSDGSALSGEIYAKVMRPAIEAIRGETSDRVIFVDMPGYEYAQPVKELVDTGVVQTWHPYIFREIVSAYPYYQINGFVDSWDERWKGEQFTLAGDFPAGTTVLLSITGFHEDGDLILTTDAGESFSHAIGKEKVGEHGCVEVGTDGEVEWRTYNGNLWEIQLEKGAGVMVFARSTPGWYEVDQLQIDTGGQTYTFLASPSLVRSEAVPVLNLAGDGSVTAAEADTLKAMDKAMLSDAFRIMTDFRDETGIQIMAQEFGISAEVGERGASSEIACAEIDDLLSVFQELDIPWCCWTDGFGPIWEKSEVETKIRLGAEFHDLENGYYIETKLMDVFQKYMK